MNALLGFPRLVEGAARLTLEDAWRRKRADNGFVSATISATDEAAAAATLESIVRSSGATLPPLSPLVTGETALRIGAFQHRTRSAAALLHDNSQEANQAFDQALVQAIREEFRGLTLAEAAHDGMWHFLAAYVVPEPLLARWPADESDGMVKLNKERLLMERRHALKDAFRRGAWIEPRFDDLVGARVWEDIRGRPSLFGDPRAVTVYLEHLAGAGEAGEKTRQQTDILREVALRLYRKAALIATPLLSDAQFADVVASAVEEARGTRPTARETVSGGPLVDFIYQAATLGVDIEPALRFEAPSWGEVPALEDALRERAAELGTTAASEIADLHLRLLARWRQLENELRRVALAGILHFLLEADGHDDARAGGLLDDLAVANLATQVIAAYTQSADINL